MTPQPPYRIIRTVLSGTFKRDVAGLEQAYTELHRLGCNVLSPHSLAFTSCEQGFLKTAAEQERSFAELERHHLYAILESDFVWAHIPGGYIGPSTALEIGFATAHHKPVFAINRPLDPALAPYVTVVPSLQGLVVGMRGHSA